MVCTDRGAEASDWTLISDHGADDWTLIPDHGADDRTLIPDHGADDRTLIPQMSAVARSRVLVLGTVCVSYYGDVSLYLALAFADVSVGCEGVPSLHGVDDGHVGEQHDRHGQQEAAHQDGDDVGLVDAGVAGFSPVYLTGPVAAV